MAPEDQRTIYSIGHSNVGLADFFKLLRMHDIQVLIDVRSAPYSRYLPHFNKASLAEESQAVGLEYVYLGRELGGRPDQPDLYDDGGHAIYARIAEMSTFKDGIRELTRQTNENRVVMMCSEEDPTECHRRLLVGRVLQEDGLRLLHIRGDGRLITEADLPLPSYQRPIQRGFFDAEAESLEELWKSTQSVLPRSLRKNSSDA